MQSDKRSHDTLMSKNLNKTYCKVFSPGKKKMTISGKEKTRRATEKHKSNRNENVSGLFGERKD